MKKYIIFLFSFLLFVSMPLAAQDSSEVLEEQFSESAVITIEGMACQEGCADAISANLKKVTGVITAEVSFAGGQANIDFNPDEVSLETLITVITNTKVKDYIYTIKEAILVEDN